MTAITFVEPAPANLCEYIERNGEFEIMCPNQSINTVTLPQKGGKKIRVCAKHQQTINRVFADIRATARARRGGDTDAAGS